MAFVVGLLRTRQADFYFFNLNKEKKSTVNCTFNHQETTNAISRFNRFENNFVVSEVFLAPKSNNSTFTVSFSHPLAKKKYQLKTRLRTMLTSTERGPLADIDNRNLNLGTYFSSQWKGGWNVNLQGTYQLSEQKQGVAGQTWHTWTMGAGLRYKTKKWNGNVDYDWQLNRIAGPSTQLHVLGFRLDYGLNKWLTISLFGQDILNLSSSQALRLTMSPAFIEQAEYERLQGSLMVGVKASF